MTLELTQARSLRALAEALRALVDAARRAHDRGDALERNRLLDEADAQLGRLIDAMPAEPRRR